jgi:hypothetical protein
MSEHHCSTCPGPWDGPTTARATFSAAVHDEDVQSQDLLACLEDHVFVSRGEDVADRAYYSQTQLCRAPEVPQRLRC